ncbi:MAG: hypothetical protein JXM79_11065 [Sedimentisphaerales bacterium]|nr:hypothetical protein [Sedimentisphaerales bacterium]
MANEREEYKALHETVCRLWQRYQDLTKAVLTLRSEINDVEILLNEAGQKICTLYRISDAGLDGERPSETSAP